MIFLFCLKLKSKNWYSINSNIRNGFLILFGILLNSIVYSQQGKIDPTFNTYDDGLLGDGFDNTVRTLSLQGDGKLIVGGDYLNFNGASTSFLSRLYPDGTKDDSFVLGTGFNGKIYSSLLQADGKIILGGTFTSYNGSAVGRLIRLNNDGSQDASFNTSIAVSSGIVYASALQSDGKIIIVGSFTTYNGLSAYRVARILPDGNLDTTFVAGSGASGRVEEVQIQSDGKIIVAGSFDSFNGFPNSGKIVRLNTDGSIDGTFATGIGFDDSITALDIQDDEKILVGGVFTNYNGVPANRIARLNTDGSVDTGFVSGSGFSNGGVAVIKVDAAGAIRIGGSFSGTYNGTDVNRLVLLDGNGVLDSLFDIGSGPSSATVYALAGSPDNSWYIGGSFSVFDSQNQGRLAKIDAFGTLDIGYLTAGVGFNNSVLKILSLPDNKVMAFGSFSKFNGTASSRIARLLENGTLDPTFNSAGSGADGLIRNAAIQSDNKIVLVGSFTNYNGTSANRITRILPDGSLDLTFDVGTGSNNQIYGIALQPDGKIIIGGNFTNFNGTSVNRIIRLLADGSIDESFDAGLGADAIIETVLLQLDGKIVVGGRFSTFNGSTHNRLVRLNTDGSIDLSFSVGSGFDKNVYAMAIQSDDKLLIGGTFLNYNGATIKRMARLNIDGSLDYSFATGTGFSNGEVRTILIQPDNRILIGGSFSGNYNGTTVKRMLRLLPNGIYDTTFSVNLNGTLFSSCFTPDYYVMIGGNFNSVSGITKHRVARIKLCTSSTIWDGTAWSNGPPSAGKVVTFNADYPSLNSVTICSCTISSGNTVTIPNENTLGLVFDYSGSGTLVLENNASLYQSDDQIVNTGNVRLKRQTTPILKSDYTYWSSPVSNQQLISLSPNTSSSKFYSYDATADDWVHETVTNTMVLGKGYIIRGPENFSNTISTVYEAVFSSVPNNGIISVPIAAADTWNLIGNPYPSAIEADLFLTENTGIIDGTIYFWTHNTPLTNYVYTADDYAVYNLLGGVGTSAATNLGVNNTKPDGKIASGQAFFVTGMNGGGMAIFNNSMRVVGQNSLFYKSNTKKKSFVGIEKHRLWLNLSNSLGAFKQLLLGYATGATNQNETTFDGESVDGNKYLDFYSINEDVSLVIQARALPFEETDEVPLGYKTEIEGTFSISIDDKDGLFENQSVFIEDKETNNIHDLRNEAYSFFSSKGTFNDRFVLRYTDRTLSVSDFNKNKNSVLIFNKKKQLKITSLDGSIDSVTVYDLTGKLVYQRKKVEDTELTIFDLTCSQGVLLVKTVLKNGNTVVKKVIN
ncbi:T9SS sorting signal type C domain-containing protein [Flavobacterium maritimum]|uniref:T9SS sorting signal type C domain-containing protein n=1 Tax=Flavobacterium maritimum TaxID=3149042 RepID=UPI0032B4FB04